MMYEMSGSPVLRSGVGTQIETPSQPERRLKSVVAVMSPCSTSAAEPAVGDVLDVGGARVDAVGDALVHVDSYDLEAGLGEDDGEREADVAEADDAHAGRLVVDAGEEALERFGRVSRGHGAGWKERKRGVGT